MDDTIGIEGLSLGSMIAFAIVFYRLSQIAAVVARTIREAADTALASRLSLRVGSRHDDLEVAIVPL